MKFRKKSDELPCRALPLKVCTTGIVKVFLKSTRSVVEVVEPNANNRDKLAFLRRIVQITKVQQHKRKFENLLVEFGGRMYYVKAKYIPSQIKSIQSNPARF